MKYCILAVLCFSCFACLTTSCKKEVGIKIPVHDTTLVTVRDTVVNNVTIIKNAGLIGTWLPVGSTAQYPTFGNDTVVWSNSYKYRYLCSGDSIYHVYSNTSFESVCGYAVGPTMDTLTLFYTSAPYQVVKYFRQL